MFFMTSALFSWAQRETDGRLVTPSQIFFLWLFHINKKLLILAWICDLKAILHEKRGVYTKRRKHHFLLFTFHQLYLYDWNHYTFKKTLSWQTFRGKYRNIFHCWKSRIELFILHTLGYFSVAIWNIGFIGIIIQRTRIFATAHSKRWKSSLWNCWITWKCR